MKKLILGLIFSLLFATTVYAAGFKTADGKKYLINDNGEAVTGWITEDYRPAGEAPEAWKTAVYYAEADGAVAVKKWLQIPVTDAGTVQNYWFYFGDTGKKVYNNRDTESLNRLIDGKNYAFAADGHMMTGWAKVKDSDDDVSGWRYYQADGTCQPRGWFEAPVNASLDIEGAKAGKKAWFYSGENGRVEHSSLVSVDKNSKNKYLFNEFGEMVTGLVIVSFESGTRVSEIQPVRTLNEVEGAKGCGDTDDKTGLYLFGDDGLMKTGKQLLTIEGQECQFFFTNSGSRIGKGFSGVQGSRYYTDGVMVKADPVSKLEIIDLKNGKQALLNSEGVVFTSGTHKDADGNKYKVKNGVVEQVD